MFVVLQPSWLPNPIITSRISDIRYPKVIPYTKFEHFGIVRFWGYIETNRRTRTSCLNYWNSRNTTVIGERQIEQPFRMVVTLSAHARRTAARVFARRQRQAKAWFHESHFVDDCCSLLIGEDVEGSCARASIPMGRGHVPQYLERRDTITNVSPINIWGVPINRDFSWHSDIGLCLYYIYV